MTEPTDTLPAWLYQRFAVIHGAPAWDRTDDGHRAYWEDHARAVRRAVGRGGFKTSSEPTATTPEHGKLWSLLDWSFWGAGMGDVFREPLADTMLAAVPAETIAQAEAIMAEFIERREIKKTGVTIYQEQRDELEQLRARAAELGAELAKYVGHEPTIAEEMAYLSDCFFAVHQVCDEAEQRAKRWEHPLPVPEWVTVVRAAASGERPEDPNDNRRRLYVDGKGNGWISVRSDEGTEWVVPVEPAAAAEQDVRDIADETGGLREIGRCWR